MGSAVGKLLGGNRNKIEFMESTKIPTAKDMDMRRRNSLMFFMRDWQELSTFEEQKASMLQVQTSQTPDCVDIVHPYCTHMNENERE